MIGLEGKHDRLWLDKEEKEPEKIMQSGKLCLWLSLPWRNFC